MAYACFSKGSFAGKSIHIVHKPVYKFCTVSYIFDFLVKKRDLSTDLGRKVDRFVDK